MVKHQVYTNTTKDDSRSVATDRPQTRQTTPGHQLPYRPRIRKLSRHRSLDNQVRDS
jgi:hypothetical protein